MFISYDLASHDIRKRQYVYVAETSFLTSSAFCITTALATRGFFVFVAIVKVAEPSLKFAHTHQKLLAGAELIFTCAQI